MADADDNLVQQYKIICPSPNELSVIINNIKCNQCGLIFKNESSLRFHDVKIHQRKNLEKTDKEISIHYHCPEKTCIYSTNSSRHFTTMKYLKQHYLKVHADKRYSCTQCEKCFSTEAAKLAHIRVCGLEFTCSCFKIYPSYEALLTHAKRQSHHVDDKYKNMFRKTNSSTKVSSLSSSSSSSSSPPAQYINIGITKKPIAILPYKENLITVKCTKETSTCDSSTQTDDIKKIKKISTLAKINKRRESRQTQTNYLSKESKNCRKTVETQTISSIRETAKKINRKSKQTSPKHHQNETPIIINNNNNNNIFSHEKSSLELNDDIGLQYYWNQRNTSSDGTQTDQVDILLDDVFNNSITHNDDNIQYIQKNNSLINYPQDYYDVTRISDPLLTEENYIINGFSSIETQTEQPVSSSLMYNDFELTSTNIETQTTESFNDFEQLIYTNMCTQTCNEILPSELGLSDTQTQTAWPELETNDSNDQTTQINQFVGIQTSHTQTQTDLLSFFDKLQ